MFLLRNRKRYTQHTVYNIVIKSAMPWQDSLNLSTRVTFRLWIATPKHFFLARFRVLRLIFLGKGSRAPRTGRFLATASGAPRCRCGSAKTARRWWPSAPSRSSRNVPAWRWGARSCFVACSPGTQSTVAITTVVNNSPPPYSARSLPQAYVKNIECLLIVCTISERVSSRFCPFSTRCTFFVFKMQTWTLAFFCYAHVARRRVGASTLFLVREASCTQNLSIRTPAY